jgi:glycosyltransferase involved in cell wall biosynthesis
MPTSDVTVVIPVHGRGPFLDEALASVRGEPAEILVVEDGTQDVDEARVAGARLVRLDHVGRSRARNAGVEAATTPYVAFLDEDDVRIAGGLARQVAALEAAPRAVMTYGRVIVGDTALEPIAEWNDVLDPRFDQLAARGTTFDAVAELGGPLYLSATMVRRDAFLAAGGFDSAFDAHEDLDFYLRIAHDGRLVPTEGAPVTRYRVHGSNTPSNALYQGTLDVAAKHLLGAHGIGRRALLERRVDALWSLGDFRRARREALRAALAEPLLLRHARFVKRLLALLAPTRLLAARR